MQSKLEVMLSGGKELKDFVTKVYKSVIREGESQNIENIWNMRDVIYDQP